jgi:hypothetical protein
MSEDDGSQESFEDAVRSIFRDLSGSIERIASVDLDDVAQAIGVDLGRAREFADSAVAWLRGQAEGLGEDGNFWAGGSRGTPAQDVGPPASAGPHPLDMPTAAQGAALAALDSGRLSVEPGSDTLATDRDGTAAADTPGLIDELRARDWIAAGGEITLTGRRALSRWLDAAA